MFGRLQGVPRASLASGGRLFSRRSAALCTSRTAWKKQTSSSGIWSSLGLCTAAGMGLYLYSRETAYAADAAVESEPTLKEKVFGNYENRIREMSAPEKVFEYFASVQKGTGKDKQMYMTPADFIRAITPYDARAGADVGLAGSKFSNTQFSERMDTIMNKIDQNGDGLISFSEFIFFTTLLSIPPKYFKVAFQMFDEDGNGEVDIDEFRDIMRILRSNNPLAKAQRTNPLSTANVSVDEEIANAGSYPVFFGEDGKKHLSFNKFREFLVELREAVLHTQFDVLAGGRDTITAKDFANSVVSYANARSIPSFAPKIAYLSSNPYKISYEEFQGFHKVLESLDEIDFAIQSFLTGGEPFQPHHLQRAAKAIANVDLSDKLVGIVFYIFDRDGDGRLDYEEFVGVMKSRQNMGISKHRDMGAMRFLSCCKDCWKKEMVR